ncbi:DUF1134 domain-containing protein [Qipengyuania gelatinilytica]|uniref:DUF1134 domain-containing protein n=1 Tax=Qipengyuania gelatinilytica TaxID=2867231 RepID=A0ABX9A7A2_9SPHN|nr:DUF1134 domain-containing protein [Qipengyuania gelatinilytica]QZD96184.1 DUF1134 domain-containing protein [Qipengyuania gelatinilytica]
MNTARTFAAALLAAFSLAAAPLAAQVESVDPDAAYDAPIDGDLESAEGELPAVTPDDATTAEPGFTYEAPAEEAAAPQWSEQDAEAAASDAVSGPQVENPDTTYREDDLIGAAEGVFGKGAEGVAKMIRKLLADQGEPNGYIVGREAGGAFVVGARYGSGTLYHKVEGERPVYWTGPSIGFDAGANAGSTFVLVYNLYDTEELYSRFPAAEGQAYAVGGLNASYVRKGDIVLIPIRVGAGLRLGVNAGYMKFSKKQKWLPF